MEIAIGQTVYLQDAPYGGSITRRANDWVIDAYRNGANGQTAVQYGWLGEFADAHARLVAMLQDWGYAGELPIPEPEPEPEAAG